jgi:hypothetical protein
LPQEWRWRDSTAPMKSPPWPRSDPRAIPVLIRLIQPQTWKIIVSLAIEGLARHKEQAAVTGLIDCFDVPCKSTHEKGSKATVEVYRNDIARALQYVTGQRFGADKDKWREWWQATGQHDPQFK